MEMVNRTRFTKNFYHCNGINSLPPEMIWAEICTKENDVKIELELHGGFFVHTPYTLLKLHEATCEASNRSPTSPINAFSLLKNQFPAPSTLLPSGPGWLEQIVEDYGFGRYPYFHRVFIRSMA